MLPPQKTVPSDQCTQQGCRRSAQHSCSLIRLFTGCIFDSQACKIFSCGQWRLWSVCADAWADLSLHTAHTSEGTFSHVSVQISQEDKIITYYHGYLTGVKIGPVSWANKLYFVRFLCNNICCWYSLELPLWGSSYVPTTYVITFHGEITNIFLLIILFSRPCL